MGYATENEAVSAFEAFAKKHSVADELIMITGYRPAANPKEKIMTLLEKLRGKPWAQVRSAHATVYRQGLVLSVLLIVAVAVIGPELVQFDFGLGVVASMFGLLFSTVLAVRFDMPDGSEI